MSTQLRDFAPAYSFLFAASGSLIFLDQLTKWLVRQNLHLGETWTPYDWLAPYARIVNWHNTGAAFGLFQEGGMIFAALAILVSLAIIVYYPLIPASDSFLRAALALQLAGALGNLIDRLTIGAVTDFISIWRFPVFNVADASITLGVILLLFPYAAHFPAEYASTRTLQRARQLNVRGRERFLPARSKPEDEEAITLGILDLLLQDVPGARKFILTQRAKRIRIHHARHRHPLPDGETPRRPLAPPNRPSRPRLAC